MPLGSLLRAHSPVAPAVLSAAAALVLVITNPADRDRLVDFHWTMRHGWINFATQDERIVGCGLAVSTNDDPIMRPG
jgi:hypothetical protein